MGHVKVTAEGIERQQEFDILKKMKCDEFQGYLFGRPMDKSKLLAHWRHALFPKAPLFPKA